MHNFNPEEIYQRIIDKANEDGIITSDEQALIDNVKDNIAIYSAIVKESYEDEIITSEEQNDMYLTRKQILKEAIEIANKDDTITQDEFNLLQIIRRIITDMEDQEHY